MRAQNAHDRADERRLVPGNNRSERTRNKHGHLGPILEHKSGKLLNDGQCVHLVTFCVCKCAFAAAPITARPIVVIGWLEQPAFTLARLAGGLNPVFGHLEQSHAVQEHTPQGQPNADMK